ncbi:MULTISPECIES: hypothetical protein [unclassified Microbacterium]|nr:MULTISPECIES: hypothetical protein [unclassified Microbacterium]MCR2786107.1 hypothetical protein [Microbacterium sp. zg.B96]WIM17681.1 hypothetical protein QNO11_05200 [Microbacterium sp. zg-B96]
MNLVVVDVILLSRALQALLLEGEERLIDRFAYAALRASARLSSSRGG